MDLGQHLHHNLEDIGARCMETAKMLSNPKYKAELEAIDKRSKALDAKIHRDLDFDDEGLQMWKLHMDNDEFKENVAEDQAIGEEWKKFVVAHKKVQAELMDLKHDILEELQYMGERLKTFHDDVLMDPKYKAELKAIGEKREALGEKVKRNMKWDDEGLDMWTLRMNNKDTKESIKDYAVID